MGDECPRPGTAAFQITPDDSVNLTGTEAVAEVPLGVGPRHQGQSSSADNRGKSAIPCSWPDAEGFQARKVSHTSNTQRRQSIRITWLPQWREEAGCKASHRPS